MMQVECRLRTECRRCETGGVPVQLVSGLYEMHRLASAYTDLCVVWERVQGRGRASASRATAKASSVGARADAPRL